MVQFKSLVIFLIFLIQVEISRSQNVDTLVDVGKYKLHFNIVTGKGFPIIFESGAGNDGNIWKDILQPLHDSTGATLVTYDREGFGESGIDTSLINITNEVKGLEVALKKLKLTDQYFFVAHSLGGNYMMTFAQRNRDKVKGAVLIDILVPCFMTKKKAIEVKNLFKDSLEVIKRLSLGFYYIVQNYENTSLVMRQAARGIKIPLTIICSDIPPFQGADSIKWKRCLLDFARGAGNRSFVLANGCGHYVFQDNPTLVIKEIIRLYRIVSM